MSLADKIPTPDDFTKMNQDRLRRSGQVILQATREALDDPGTSELHSLPGEAPRRQTGELMNSAKIEIRDQTLTLIFTAPYASFVGKTRNLKAGVEASASKVRDILLEGK